MRRGFTLIEVVIAIIISFIALFGIGTLIAASFRDWREVKEAVDLERDLDLASYRIKGVLEEADGDTILGGGTRLVAGYNSVWLKEFYRTAGNALIFKNDLIGSTETIINTLESVNFANGSDNRSVRVDLTVIHIDNKTGEVTRRIPGYFLVYLRNKGGG